MMVYPIKPPPDEKAILEDITPFLDQQEKERDFKFEIESYGHRERRIEFLRDALSEFFEQDIEDIVKVEPVWKWLQYKLKDDIDYILSDKEEFVKSSWKLEDAYDDALSDLESSLDNLLRKQHRETWRRKTLQDAIQQLEEWKDKGIFVAVLDKEGKMLEEPYPVIIDSEVKMKVAIEPDSIHKYKKNIVVRFEKPIRENVVAMVLCKVPEGFDKAEIIKL